VDLPDPSTPEKLMSRGLRWPIFLMVLVPILFPILVHQQRHWEAWKKFHGSARK
jgi:hypothetical protein